MVDENNEKVFFLKRIPAERALILIMQAFPAELLFYLPMKMSTRREYRVFCNIVAGITNVGVKSGKESLMLFSHFPHKIKNESLFILK